MGSEVCIRDSIIKTQGQDAANTRTARTRHTESIIAAHTHHAAIITAHTHHLCSHHHHSTTPIRQPASSQHTPIIQPSPLQDSPTIQLLSSQLILILPLSSTHPTYTHTPINITGQLQSHHHQHHIPQSPRNHSHVFHTLLTTYRRFIRLCSLYIFL